MADTEQVIEEGFVDISPEKDGGLLKKILVEGTGEDTPPSGSSVSVHYVGTLHSDGSDFDSSRKRPGTFQFDVGVGQVIKGWDVGICTMKKGEKCILRARHDFAYGEGGSPPKIPGGATLNFEVELFSWKEKVKPVSQMSATERFEYASKQKELGTQAFKNGDLQEALEYYGEGVQYGTYFGKAPGDNGHSHGGAPCSGHHGESSDDDVEPDGMPGMSGEELSEDAKKLAVALLNNCAMIKVKLGDSAQAKSDCTRIIDEFDATNVKAFFRRAQAELALGDYGKCDEDIVKLLEIDPENKEAQQLRRKAKDAEKKAKQKEKAMCSKMFG